LVSSVVLNVVSNWNREFSLVSKTLVPLQPVFAKTISSLVKNIYGHHSKNWAPRGRVDELKHFTCSLPQWVCGTQAGICHTYLPSLPAYSYTCQCCHT